MSNRNSAKIAMDKAKKQVNCEHKNSKDKRKKQKEEKIMNEDFE